MNSGKILSALLILGSGFLTAAPHAGTLNGSGSMTGTEPTMNPRFFRDGGGGTAACSEFSSGNFQYQAIDMVSDGSGAMTATFDPGACGTAIFITFHSPTFNPANICTDHQWNFGSSVAFANQSFSVPPNSPVRMIVSGVQGAPGVVCGPFTYSIDGVGGTNTLAENIDCARNAINVLSPPDVAGPAQKSALFNLLGVAKNYLGTPYQSLSLTTVNSVLARTDGCPLRTTPDTIMTHGGAGADWIATCAAQATIYSCLKDAQTQLMAPLKMK